MKECACGIAAVDREYHRPEVIRVGHSRMRVIVEIEAAQSGPVFHFVLRAPLPVGKTLKDVEMLAAAYSDRVDCGDVNFEGRGRYLGRVIRAHYTNWPDY